MSDLHEWTIDPVHTHLEFAVRHLMIATVKGRFTDVRGTVRMREDDPAGAQMDVEIGAASITTGIEQRDNHLRSPDFLDVERFPALRFRSRGIALRTDGSFDLVGDLTIRDVTREVTLAVSPEGKVWDPWGGRRAGFSATGRIRRSDFGITWNQVVEAGGVAVGDEVRITIEVELVRAALPAAA